MKPERRTAQRLRPSELTYLDFGEGLGGMVWNASEKGLSFQAVAAVQAGCLIPLCISPNPANRIELLGTVVWTDQSKKFGGLKFTEPCEQTRERLRTWLAQEPGPPIADQKVARPVLPEEKSAGLRSNEEHRSDDSPQAWEVSRETDAMRAAIAMAATSSRAPLSSALFGPEQVLPQGARVASRSLHSRALSITLLIVAVLTFSIVAFPNLRAASGGALIRLGETLKGKSQAQAVDSSSSTLQISAPVISVRPPQAGLTGQGPSNDSAERPAAPTQARETSERVNPPQTHLSKLVQIAKPRGRIPAGDRRSLVAKQLWSNIGAGDVTAEVALAQLYLAGDGVPRSCEQARVLLKAASSSGHTIAKQQLRNLKKKDCR